MTPLTDRLKAALERYRREVFLKDAPNVWYQTSDEAWADLKALSDYFDAEYGEANAAREQRQLRASCPHGAVVTVTPAGEPRRDVCAVCGKDMT